MKTDRIILFLIRNNKSLFFLALVIIVGMVLLIRPVSITGDFSGFEMRQNPYQQVEKTLSEEFHTRSLIQLKITQKDQPISVLCNNLNELENDVKAIIPDAHILSIHQIDKLLFQLYGKEASAMKVLERCHSLPFLSNMISSDNRSFLFLIQVTDNESFPLEAFNQLIGEDYAGIVKMNPMSYFHISDDIETALRKDLVLIPIVLLLITIGLILMIFKRVSALAYIFGQIFISMIPIFFILSVFKIPISLGTILILPVVIVIALADGIHLLVGYHNQDPSQNRQEAAKKTLKLFIVPSFLTSLTTAVAFCSFGLSESVGIRHFGLITGIVVLFEFFLTFMISPYWLSRLSISNLNARTLSNIFPVLVRYRKPIGAFLLVLLISAALFIPQLKFATNYEKFFPSRSNIASTYEEFKRDFKSPVSMDIVLALEKPTRDILSGDYPAFTELDALVDEIKGLDEVKRVNSVAGIKAFTDRFKGFGLLVDYSDDHHPFYNKEKQLYRINIWTETTDDLYLLKDKVTLVLEQYSSVFSSRIYGSVFLLDYVNQSVARSLFRSLLLSSLLIFVIFALLSRNLRVALVSILANIIPLSAMVLIFVFWDLNLNILTSWICVICLGLMVDDTIHILYRKVQLKSSVGKLSEGMITSSLILFGGFAIHGLSSFEPTRNFGLTCSIIFMLTLVSDLVLIPWGVELFSRKEKNKTDDHHE